MVPYYSIIWMCLSFINGVLGWVYPFYFLLVCKIVQWVTLNLYPRGLVYIAPKDELLKMESLC